MRLAYTDRIVDLGETPSLCFKVDSSDNAVAGSQFALFITGLIGNQRPWQSVEKLDL